MSDTVWVSVGAARGAVVADEAAVSTGAELTGDVIGAVVAPVGPAAGVIVVLVATGTVFATTGAKLF